MKKITEQEESKEDKAISTTFTLINKNNQNAKEHAFYSLFLLFMSKEAIKNNLEMILQHFTLLKVSFENVLKDIMKFVVKWQAPGDKIGTQEYVGITMDIHEKFKQCANFFWKSDFFQLIPFLLRCCWSNDYSENPTLTIQLPMANINWFDIPISSYEVICVYDAIICMMDEFGVYKSSLNQWYKYKLTAECKIAIYIQSLDYMCLHVQSLINEL